MRRRRYRVTAAARGNCWIVEQLQSNDVTAVFSHGFPFDQPVMRTHFVGARPDWNRQRWDAVAKVIVDDPAMIAAQRHRAVLTRFADAQRVTLYARKANEARAVMAGNDDVEPLVISAEAEARGMTVHQLAALVVERAEQDAQALARAWGWQEAQRVRELKQ